MVELNADFPEVFEFLLDLGLLRFIRLDEDGACWISPHLLAQLPTLLADKAFRVSLPVAWRVELNSGQVRVALSIIAPSHLDGLKVRRVARHG